MSLDFNFTKPQKIILGVGAVLILIIAWVFIGFPGVSKDAKPAEFTLNVFGIYGATAFETTINNFEKAYPNVKVNYVELSEKNYEEALINSLASSDPANTPDVFMTHRSWVTKHANKMLPFANFTPTDVEESYPTVVKDDFTIGNNVYALPLYLDSLVLYYNKDLLNKNKISVLPKTWEDLIAASKKIGKNSIGIGTSSATVERAYEILDLIFLQRGTEMTDRGYNNATFAATGADAFDFYLSFANPNSSWFAWDKNNSSSFSSFVSGESAFFFGFLRDKKVLQDSAPFMNLGVLPAPQFASPDASEINLADYYGLAAAKQTPHPTEAQQFVLYATSDPVSNTDLLNNIGESPALRTLINDGANSSDLKIWTSQALTAKAWQEPDLSKVINIFDTAINQVNFKGLESYAALREAEASVSSLMRGF